MRNMISDNESQTIVRILDVNWGPKPRTAVTPRYLVINAMTAIADRTVQLGEDAARELLKQLKSLLGES